LFVILFVVCLVQQLSAVMVVYAGHRYINWKFLQAIWQQGISYEILRKQLTILGSFAIISMSNIVF
jgi:uncharacterized membrane protein